jgi:hypothetical protein
VVKDGKDRLVKIRRARAGWPEPLEGDFPWLKPGKKIIVWGLTAYLCDGAQPGLGAFRTYIFYRNTNDGKALGLKNVWTGSLSTPSVPLDIPDISCGKR